MLNIIKSLNYSAKRDTVNILTIITMLILPVFFLYISGMLGDVSLTDMTPSVYFTSQSMASIFIFSCFGIMIFSSKLVASDAGDKTINYEFLSGHSRTRIFMARTIAGFLWGAVLSLILLMIPVGIMYMMNGWGPETDRGDVIFRFFLLLFPIIRLASYNIMLASVTRSAGKGIALGYATLMVVAMMTSIFSDILDIDIIYPFGFTNGSYLLISENARNVIIDGKTVTVYDTAVPADMIWKTIAVSLTFTAIYLTVTYINYKKKDRD